MKITITHLNGSRQGQTEVFALPVLQVGRGLESDIRLDDESAIDRVASRRHAEFCREGNELVLYDLESRNGTLVNGKRIQRAVLMDNDRVELGVGGPAMRINILVSETEEIDFLQASRLFGALSTETLLKILSAGTIEVYPAGSYLFRVGQTCEYLYAIKSGVVEVWRDTNNDGNLDVATYLTIGDVISPAIILIEHISHQSAARIPEGAVLFKLTRAAFRQLILSIPELALSVCTALAQQLDSTYKKLRTHNYQQLQGNLNFFDLATVIQTLMTSRQTGVLSISSIEVGFARSGLWASSDEIVLPSATIHFVEGQVVYARCGVLNAEEAFFQLFQGEFQGSFTFQEGQSTKAPIPQGTITLSGFNLVLEAVRMQDELKELKKSLTDSHTRYVAVVSEFSWPEPIYGRAAQLIWEKLKSGTSIAQLQGEVPFCDFAIYFVISTLLNSGQIASAH